MICRMPASYAESSRTADFMNGFPRCGECFRVALPLRCSYPCEQLLTRTKSFQGAHWFAKVDLGRLTSLVCGQYPV